MATLLLSCDQSVKYFNGEFYAKNQERLEFFQRYLRVFDKLRLAVRCEKEEVFNTSWRKLDKEKIEIAQIPDFSGPVQYLKVYFAIGKSIHDITSGCDAAIIRLPSTIGQRVAHKVMEAGIPYAVEIVYDARDGASNSKSLVERLLWKRIDKDMRFITSKALGVSCVTENYLQQHYLSKQPNAFSSHYSSLSLCRNFYTSGRRFPNKERLSIVHVSNQVDCNTRKGHIQLIEMISLLKSRGVNVDLLFVGEDYHDGVEKLSQMAAEAGVLDKIKFSGRVNRSELSDILEKSDLFVFPTAAEGLPRVVIEAMAKGLPCVISNVSGNPELVSPNMLVDYKDVMTLADKVEALINDKYLYEFTSKQNFEKSLSYEASILEKRRDEFYKKLKSKVKS